MTKKEYSQIIKSFGIKIEDFFLDVGRKPNSLGNIKANEQVPENYIKLLNLYKDKLDKEKLLTIGIILHLNDFVKKIASIMNTKIIEKRNELISGRENK